MSILVTGAAGFIGFHVAKRLLANGEEVVGIDNLNDYYDVSLKRTRLAQLEGSRAFRFQKVDIADRHLLADLFKTVRPQRVVHLAAQAGVRYSITNPHAYTDSNLTGFVNVLEGCRHNNVEHLVYASSSSVYGASKQVPFSVSQNVDHPVSLYAATKKANELMAHTYSHLYRLPTTGLRIFTVYGPWGRPDMATFLFTRAILAGQPIDVFNHGHMTRDFTYVDDIAEAITRVVQRIPKGDPNWSADHSGPGTSPAPYKIYNLGNNKPVELLHLIETLEKCLGKTAIKRMLSMQPGDVPATWANIDDLARDIGFAPNTSIEVGLRKFTEWYLDYYRL
jgi:UDP-glucuronate 4-epimerase